MKRLALAFLIVAELATAQVYTGVSVGTLSVLAPQIVASRTSCPAPCGIVFDATGTVNSGGFHEFGEVRYDWDFGETGLGNWTYYGSSKNVEKDVPIAAHTFETPGTFTVTLTATDPNGATASTTQDVTIADPDSTFSGTNTVCVSSSGTFTGCPSGATQTTSSDADANIQTGATKRTLFNRGETFTFDTVKNFNSAGPTQVGAYGSGAAPIWNIPNTYASTSILRFNLATTSGLTVYDIDVDNDDSGTRFLGTTGSYEHYSDLTLLRVTRNAGSSVNSDLAVLDIGGGSADSPHGIVLQENVWAECSADCIFMKGRMMAFLGNSIEHGNSVHIQRNGLCDQSIIAHGHFADQGNTGGGGLHLLKIHAPGGAQSYGDGDSQECVIAYNDFVGTTTVPGWEVTLGPQNTSAGTENEYVHEVLIKGNRFKCESNTCLQLWTTTNTWVRDNFFIVHDSDDGAFFHNRGASHPDVTQTNVHYWNNTCYEGTAGGAEDCVRDIGSSGSDAYNTLFISAGETGDPVNGTTTEVSSLTGNLTGECPFVTCPPSPTVITDFELAAGTAPVDAGTCHPRHKGLDYEGTVRPQGAACDIGADER